MSTVDGIFAPVEHWLALHWAPLAVGLGLLALAAGLIYATERRLPPPNLCMVLRVAALLSGAVGLYLVVLTVTP